MVTINPDRVVTVDWKCVDVYAAITVDGTPTGGVPDVLGAMAVTLKAIHDGTAKELNK